jgi:hypothetical protein
MKKQNYKKYDLNELIINFTMMTQKIYANYAN